VESGESKAFLTSVKRTDLLKNLDNWGRFISLPDTDILEEIKDLLAGNLKLGNLKAKIPMKKLNELISSIGVDRHRFMDTFQIINDWVPGSVKMLHGGEEAQRKRMETFPNAYALPIIERGKSMFEEKAGHLIVPDRIWVETAHVTSMLSHERLIGNIFYAVRLRNESEDRLKALCLWLNTTWGILTILASVCVKGSKPPVRPSPVQPLRLPHLLVVLHGLFKGLGLVQGCGLIEDGDVHDITLDRN